MSHVSHSPAWLHEQLSNHMDIIILDCRSVGDYKISHVNGAIHVQVPTALVMLRRWKNLSLSVDKIISCARDKENFKRRKATDTVVVYDKDTDILEDNAASHINTLVKKLKKDGSNVVHLKGGYQCFEQLYPMHCIEGCGVMENGSNYSSPPGGGVGSIGGQGIRGDLPVSEGLGNLCITDDISTTEHRQQQLGIVDYQPPRGGANRQLDPPTEVIPYLYLGSSSNSKDRHCLQQHKITYILNVTPNVPNTFENCEGFRYLRIPISDTNNQDISEEHFQDAINFIDEALHRQCGVLVHCKAGISRSVCITLAYLIIKKSMCFERSLELVRKQKPEAAPNLSFLLQLKNLDARNNHHHHYNTTTTTHTHGGGVVGGVMDDDGVEVDGGGMMVGGDLLTPNCNTTVSTATTTIPIRSANNPHQHHNRSAMLPSCSDSPSPSPYNASPSPYIATPSPCSAVTMEDVDSAVSSGGSHSHSGGGRGVGGGTMFFPQSGSPHTDFSSAASSECTSPSCGDSPS